MQAGQAVAFGSDFKTCRFSTVQTTDRLLETLCMIQNTCELMIFNVYFKATAYCPSLISERIPRKALLKNLEIVAILQCGVWFVEFGRCGKSLASLHF